MVLTHDVVADAACVVVRMHTMMQIMIMLMMMMMLMMLMMMIVDCDTCIPTPGSCYYAAENGVCRCSRSRATDPLKNPFTGSPILAVHHGVDRR